MVKFASMFGYLTIVLAFLWLGKTLLDMRAKKWFNTTTELNENDNLAVAFRYAGFFLGFILGILPILNQSTGNFVSTALWLALDSFLLIAFLLVAKIASDALLITKLSHREAMANQNVSVGITEFCTSISTGLIAYASLSGEGGGYVSAVIFFVLGQAVLIALIWFYELFKRYAVTDQVRKGNVSAGIMLGGRMIALALILKVSIMGPFVSWADDLRSFAIAAVGGILFYGIVEWVLDLVLLPAAELDEEIQQHNSAAVLYYVGILLSLALTVSVMS